MIFILSFTVPTIHLNSLLYNVHCKFVICEPCVAILGWNCCSNLSQRERILFAQISEIVCFPSQLYSWGWMDGWFDE